MLHLPNYRDRISRIHMPTPITRLSPSHRWDVVILGGGFAGLACAKRLERAWGQEVARRVLLISSENYFLYQPFLPEVVGGSIEPRHVINPIRVLLRHCQVQRAEVTRIDPEQRRVELVSESGAILRSIQAEHLVLALGSSTNMQAVPGMMEHGHFIKTLADALELRQLLIRRLEEASSESDAAERRALLHFVVVGGGYSGVETAGEILDLGQSVTKFYRSLDPSELRVTLVHSGTRLLPELDEPLGRFALRSLEHRGMTVLLGKRAASVGSEYLRLVDGGRLDTRTVVCTIGNAPHPVIRALVADRHKGWLPTDEFLRAKGFTNVWAIGDCAENPDGCGGRTPPTAQAANQLGVHAARNIVRSCGDGKLRVFRFTMLGQVATVGHHKGVCSILGLRLSGFFAWWLTRTIHLMKLPGMDRKLRVVIDWTLELFFPRDLNYLDLGRTHRMVQRHLEPGDVLFYQDDPSNNFYLIEQGLIELTRKSPDGEILFQEQLEAGSHFGEGSLLRQSARTTTAVAKTAATLLVFGARDFRSVFEGFGLFRQVLRETSLRFRPEEELGTANWPAELLAAPVNTIMTSPVASLPESGTIADALQLLAETQRGTLPLVDPTGRLAGLVTKTDLYRVIAEGRDFQEGVVRIASQQVVSIRGDETVRDAMGLFRRKRIKHAPVVEADGKLVGMLSYTDLACAKMRSSVSARES